MGKLSGNWITGAHSGRACNHDDIYTKVDKKTGACYSVKLCNPNTDWSEDQLAQRTSFGAISSAISQWIKTNKVSGASKNADYEKVKKMYDRQSKYSTLRGMMYAKGMYVVSETDGSVTVDITARTVRATAGGNSPSTDSGQVKRTLTLSASPSNGGTVSGAGQYNNGASATITATANSGYTFTRWSDGNTSASRSIVMDANKTLSAIFTANAGGGDSNPEGGDDEEEIR